MLSLTENTLGYSGVLSSNEILTNAFREMKFLTYYFYDNDGRSGFVNRLLFIPTIVVENKRSVG